MAKPLLFLDVDGVISPVAGAHMGPLPTCWPTWQRAPSIHMPVFFAPDLVARLTALPVERIWCSTWEKEVDTFGLSKDLGWAGQPYLKLPAPVRPWDKLVAVQEYLRSQPDRPFVWVDDDPRMVSSGMRWGRTIQTPHLLIRPEKKVGLTPRHIERMERWVEMIVGIGTRLAH
ncbi:MAG: HAD domain-containing protein [Candidatus Dormibacteria bacterium]